MHAFSPCSTSAPPDSSAGRPLQGELLLPLTLEGGARLEATFSADTATPGSWIAQRRSARRVGVSRASPADEALADVGRRDWPTAGRERSCRACEWRRSRPSRTLDAARGHGLRVGAPNPGETMLTSRRARPARVRRFQVSTTSAQHASPTSDVLATRKGDDDGHHVPLRKGSGFGHAT